MNEEKQHEPTPQEQSVSETQPEPSASAEAESTGTGDEVRAEAQPTVEPSGAGDKGHAEAESASESAEVPVSAEQTEPKQVEAEPAPAKRDLPPPPVLSGLIGRKVGMTHIFDREGRMIAVTAVELGPCYVVQVRTPERDGYSAAQIGFGIKKRQRTNKPMQGVFKKAGLSRPLAHLKEFKIIEGTAVSGQEVRAEHVFQEGEVVKVTGISKGKGFAGVVRRYGFAGGPKTHGSMTHRRPLSSGATGPQRVLKGKTMPGRMGAERVTVRGLKIVAIHPERHIVLIEGAIPGGDGGIVYVQKQR